MDNHLADDTVDCSSSAVAMAFLNRWYSVPYWLDNCMIASWIAVTCWMAVYDHVRVAVVTIAIYDDDRAILAICLAFYGSITEKKNIFN